MSRDESRHRSQSVLQRACRRITEVIVIAIRITAASHDDRMIELRILLDLRRHVTHHNSDAALVRPIRSGSMNEVGVMDGHLSRLQNETHLFCALKIHHDSQTTGYGAVLIVFFGK